MQKENIKKHPLKTSEFPLFFAHRIGAVFVAPSRILVFFAKK